MPAGRLVAEQQFHDAQAAGRADRFADRASHALPRRRLPGPRDLDPPRVRAARRRARQARPRLRLRARHGVGRAGPARRGRDRRSTCRPGTSRRPAGGPRPTRWTPSSARRTPSIAVRGSVVRRRLGPCDPAPPRLAAGRGRTVPRPPAGRRWPSSASPGAATRYWSSPAATCPTPASTGRRTNVRCGRATWTRCANGSRTCESAGFSSWEWPRRLVRRESRTGGILDRWDDRVLRRWPRLENWCRYVVIRLCRALD